MCPRTLGRNLLAAFASVLLGSLSAVAGTVFVDWQNSGSQDGTDAHPYRTRPQALAAAAPGDTIAIRTGGCYSLEGGMLNKSATVRADNGLVTISSSGIDSSATPPTLRVSSFLASYPPGVRPILGVTLTLAPTAGAPWLVTTFDYGTLSIATVTRNGVVLSPTVGPVDFLEDPKAAREAGLTALRPGQEVAIPFGVDQWPFNNGYRIMASPLTL